MKKMPVLFIGHGSPTNAAEDNRFTESWKTAAREIPKPKAILSISAHWVTRGLRINDSENPRQIYDMYGFPERFYQIRYPACGDPELAHRAAALTGALPDNSWGIDHGTWAVLTRLFPDADVPVVQLSVDGTLNAEEQLEAGKKLQPLREEGVLIFGSGSIVHSLEHVDWNMDSGYPWCLDFDREVMEKITSGDYKAAADFQKLKSYTPAVFSTPEHYYPLLTVLGAAGADDRVRVFAEGSTLGSISMTSYLIGPQSA